MKYMSSRAARSAATAIALTAAAGAVDSAHSADRLVPQQYATIQAAINASVAGDHVVVSAGTYTQAINFLGKQITVRPASTPLSVTLRAPAGARAVTFSSGESPLATLRGFRVAGSGPSGPQGGGITIQGSSPIIEQCEFVDIHSALSGGTWGGAIDIVSGSPLVRNCRLTGNRVSSSGTTRDGGAILIRGGSPTIESCDFRDNPSGQGSDVFVVSSAPVQARVMRCVFEGASGLGWGARIYNYGSGNGSATVTLDRCSFRAIAQQAVSLIHGWDTIVMEGVDFSQCASPSTHIATQSRSRLTVSECRFVNNQALFLIADPNQGGNAIVSSSYFCGNAPASVIFGPHVVDGGANIVRTVCCPGDITANGTVDGVDLAALLSAWGSNGQGQFMTDIDGDGIVSGADLAYVLSGWGPCPE